MYIRGFGGSTSKIARPPITNREPPYDTNMRELATARLILIILCASYLLSAALLTWARVAGQTVPGWKIAGWLVTGIATALLLPWLAGNRPVISIAVLILLGPWMALALTDDLRGRHFIIAAVDLAGLFAIGYALWLIREPIT